MTQGNIRPYISPPTFMIFNLVNMGFRKFTTPLICIVHTQLNTLRLYRVYVLFKDRILKWIVAVKSIVVALMTVHEKCRFWFRRYNQRGKGMWGFCIFCFFKWNHSHKHSVYLSVLLCITFIADVYIKNSIFIYFITLLLY